MQLKYPEINLELATPEMIPLLEKTLDYLATSYDDENSNPETKETYICIALNLAHYGSRTAWAAAAPKPKVIEDTQFLIETALADHGTRSFDIWWCYQHLNYKSDKYIQARRRTWVEQIIAKLKKHFNV